MEPVLKTVMDVNAVLLHSTDKDFNEYMDAFDCAKREGTLEGLEKLFDVIWSVWPKDEMLRTVAVEAQLPRLRAWKAEPAQGPVGKVTLKFGSIRGSERTTVAPEEATPK